MYKCPDDERLAEEADIAELARRTGDLVEDGEAVSDLGKGGN